MANKKVYIVSFELHSTLFRNYSNFYNNLKLYKPWMHYIKDTWFICSESDPHSIYNHLCQYIHKDDRIIITRMTTEYSGWLPQDAWDWLKKMDADLYPVYPDVDDYLR